MYDSCVRKVGVFLSRMGGNCFGLLDPSANYGRIQNRGLQITSPKICSHSSGFFAKTVGIGKSYHRLCLSQSTRTGPIAGSTAENLFKVFFSSQAKWDLQNHHRLEVFQSIHPQKEVSNGNRKVCVKQLRQRQFYGFFGRMLIFIFPYFKLSASSYGLLYSLRECYIITSSEFFNSGLQQHHVYSPKL